MLVYAMANLPRIVLVCVLVGPIGMHVEIVTQIGLMIVVKNVLMFFSM